MGEHTRKTAAGEPEATTLPRAGVTGKVTRINRLRGRKGLLIAAAGVLAIGGALGALAYIRQQTPQIAQVCDATLAKEAAAQNELKNLTTFGRVVERIKLKPNYDKDPNCLYIVAQYQMISADTPGARATIDKLKKDYADFTYLRELDGGKATISNLEKQYEANKQLEDNSSGGIDPTI